MKQKLDEYLNGIFKTPFSLEVSNILILTALDVISALGSLVRIELYRRILQALFAAEGNALGKELGFLALYEILYCAFNRFRQYKYTEMEGRIFSQLLNHILTKNENLCSLGNCPMGANDRFSMASEDCSAYASGIVSKASLFADFVTVPCYIVYGCSINGMITAAITGISIFLSMMNRKNKKKLYGYNQEYSESYAHWSNFLWKSVDNLEVIRVFLDKRKIREEQLKRNEALDDVQQRRLKTYLNMTLIEESSDMMFTLLILCASFIAVAMKRIAASDILAMVESLAAVQKAIFLLPEKLVQLQELESMGHRISSFEALEEDRGQEDETESLKRLTLRQVSFSYGEKTVLHEIDFEFETGKFYIIAGTSGCGKSTLLRVISKLLPYTGQVRWNGTELKEISRKALYRKLFYQPQNQIFLEDTIKANICLNSDDDENRYEQILKKAFIREFLDKNHMDDTQMLSYRGAPLSSGESQMVSMAGVLYEPREAILLDEVFSAIDPAKEQVFFRELVSLARSGKLVVLVSHRLSNLEAADEILFMEEGRICEAGNLNELLSVGGKFYKWHKLYS